MDKKLALSENKLIWGVCAGLGEYFNIDATIARIIYVVITLFLAGLGGVLLYIILYWVMPSKKKLGL